MKPKSIMRCMVFCLVLLLAAAPAYAGIAVSVPPDYPHSVTVGQLNVPVSLTIANGNFGGEEGHSNLITSIFHIPSCGSAGVPGVCGPGAADPGVFSVSATGTGAVGTACAGVVFTIAISDAATGEVSMTPATPITLTAPGTGPTSWCTINFTVNVLSLPTKDADAVTPGIQTAQHGRALVSSEQNPALTGGGSGTDITQVIGCGDNIVQAPETCDPPGSTPPGSVNTCRANCTYCGDGIVNNGEQCDDGNAVNGDGCSTVCEIEPFCGDGIVGNTPGETCDPPGSTPPGSVNTCRANCTYCGDGIVNNGEQCDDGNAVNGDGCSTTCQTEVCDVEVDKQVSCDGGQTWHDMGLVTNNQDGTNGCTADPNQTIMVRYQAKNIGTMGVFNCTIGESNVLLGTGAFVGNLAVRETSDFLPAGLTPICSDADQNEPNTATLTCQCGAPDSLITDTAIDRATFTCAGEEICRTPGFWATHAGIEKTGSKNITQMVIAAAGGCLEICGEKIEDTNLNDADSAVEAMCVSVQSNQRLQLVRQLTAAALNCVVSGGGSDCTDISIEDIYQACNTGCAANSFPVTVNSTQLSISDCIKRIDCFNNGGEWANGMCWYGVCTNNQSMYCNNNSQCPGNTITVTNPCIPIPGNCHDRLLGVCADGTICTEDNTYMDAYNKARCNSDNSLCVPGPAGSSNKCNAAIRSACTVIGPGELSCTSGDSSSGAESCPVPNGP